MHQLPGGPRRQASHMGTPTRRGQLLPPPHIPQQGRSERRRHLHMQQTIILHPSHIEGRTAEPPTDSGQRPQRAQLLQAHGLPVRSHLRVRARAVVRATHHPAYHRRGDPLSLLRGHRVRGAPQVDKVYLGDQGE